MEILWIIVDDFFSTVAARFEADNEERDKMDKEDFIDEL